jgi:hypothetical protein
MNLLDKKVMQTRLRAYTSVALGSALLAGSCALSASFGVKPAYAQASSLADTPPSGWFMAGSKPQSYSTGVDKEHLRNGLPSAYLVAKMQDTGGFGTLMQSIKAADYAGKRVRLRASVRSQDVTSWAGLWMRVDKGSTTVNFDNMQQRAIRGTQEWQTYDVVLDVPSDATGIAFGTLLNGAGEVWMNDIKFEVVSTAVPTTGSPAESMHSSPVNLTFQK